MTISATRLHVNRSLFNAKGVCFYTEGPGGMEEEAAFGEDIDLFQVILSWVCVSRLAVAPVESFVYVK
ncbi:hypothetical protein GOODEAATRI_003685 [Goodea atripinnis]|uniref:Uncharacterized protein n=1 Tax=Goodea atripinnis TaxID=208336 RepID=A0ABV0PKJ5_9TELE